MVENNQQLLVTGCILHLARVDANGVVGPARDVGTVQVFNPSAGSTSIQLFDSRGGRRQKISERLTEFSESYEITCSNMSLENLAFTFGANAVASYSQSALSAVAINHKIFPDSVLHLHDNSGNYIYGATAVTIAGLVAGTDFVADPTELALGYVTILPGATLSSDGEVKAVTVTSPSISGLRTFNPQTAGIANCEAWIYWTADDYATAMLRDHVRVSIAPAAPEFKDTDYSAMKMTLTVLSDLSSPTRPAGRFLQPRGLLPNRTF